MVRSGGNSYRKRFRSDGGKAGYGGDGLARSGSAASRVCWRRSCCPASACACGRAEKPGLMRAGMLEVLEPRRRSAWRPSARISGAAAAAIISMRRMRDQLAAKRAILEEELRRSGKIEPPEEIAVVAGEPWGYRNRVQLHIEDRQAGISRGALAQAVRVSRDAPSLRRRSTS